MYSNPDILHHIAVAVPIHFKADEDILLIRDILENTFRNQELVCARKNLLAIVDRGSAAEQVLRDADSGSCLSGVNVHTLEKNRCKAGAVREGLELLLQNPEIDFFVTRDCDGDHRVDDLPRLVEFLLYAADLTGNSRVCIMGSRSSLEKPMGWARQEWENLTNDILTGIVRLKLAEEGRVMDERFWNGSPPDIQSGYRVYSRPAAETAVRCLAQLPEDRKILNFACEFEPFIDINLAGGLFCQVNRLTLVEQPVSNYSNSDYAGDYGAFIEHAVQRLGLNKEAALLLFDNAISRNSLFFTDLRNELLKCRAILGGTTKPPLQAPYA
jgi:hypothetical protein